MRALGVVFCLLYLSCVCCRSWRVMSLCCVFCGVSRFVGSFFGRFARVYHVFVCVFVCVLCFRFEVCCVVCVLRLLLRCALVPWCFLMGSAHRARRERPRPGGWRRIGGGAEDQHHAHDH